MCNFFQRISKYDILIFSSRDCTVPTEYSCTFTTPSASVESYTYLHFTHDITVIKMNHLTYFTV